MSIKIGKYIFNQLSGVTSSLNALLKPVNSEQLDDYIVYKRLSVTPDYSLDGVAFNTTKIQIDIVCKDYNTSITLAESVRNIFELQQGSYAGIEIEHCEILSVDEFSDGTLFIQSLVFEFTTN